MKRRLDVGRWWSAIHVNDLVDVAEAEEVLMIRWTLASCRKVMWKARRHGIEMC